METVKDFKAFGLSLLVLGLFLMIVVLKFGTLPAEASIPKPSKADIQNLEDIKQNQQTINQLKEWNKLEVNELNKNGWNVNWDTLDIVPLDSRP